MVCTVSHPPSCSHPACSCNPEGSASEQRPCNPASGQCPCLPHVTGRDCGRCSPGFYDLQPGRGCRRWVGEAAGALPLGSHLHEGHRGASGEGPGLECASQAHCQEHSVLPWRGTKGQSLGGQAHGPASPGCRPRAALRDVQVGRGPVWCLIPFSVTLSLSDLFGHSNTLDSTFGEQWTPGRCPVKQTDFFFCGFSEPLMC